MGSFSFAKHLPAGIVYLVIPLIIIRTHLIGLNFLNKKSHGREKEFVNAENFCCMNSKEKAVKVVDQMFEEDAFSRWLGIERLTVGPGHCRLRMQIRKEMVNGFGIAHGGITYALADSALAFASNSQGRKAVSVETSISHLHPLHPGDIITAAASEEHCSNKIAVYRVEVQNQNNRLVALFKGTVYRTSKNW